MVRRSGSPSKTPANEVFDGRPPSRVLKVIQTGPITNHVNIVPQRNGTFAYVTIGGLNEVKVFRTGDFSQVATIRGRRAAARNLAVWRRNTRLCRAREWRRSRCHRYTSNKVIATIPSARRRKRWSTSPGPCRKVRERRTCSRSALPVKPFISHSRRRPHACNRSPIPALRSSIKASYKC